jgi:8-oxo-dGTP pyrophosphatase MutT (NUDIX family)
MFNDIRLAAWLKTVSRVSSAALILEDAAGRVLIVKANYKRHWTFPGGVIDVGETPAEAAVRETREEVGLTIDPATVSFGWVANRASRVADTYQFVFRASLPAGMESHIELQATEIDDYAFVDRAEVARGERDYGKVIEHWANNASGYVEQTFGVTS